VIRKRAHDRLDIFQWRERQQAFRQPREVPEERFGLPPESIKTRLVEIGGGEGWVENRQEAPRAVIEALTGDVDVVGVENAMHEACGHPLRPGARHVPADPVQERESRVFRLGVGTIGHVVGDRMVQQRLDAVGLFQIGKALECPDADVGMAEPHQNR